MGVVCWGHPGGVNAEKAASMGHPLGCSGARIMTTLLYEMRRRQLQFGLATLCVGAGQGVSTIIEVLN